MSEECSTAASERGVFGGVAGVLVSLVGAGGVAAGVFCGVAADCSGGAPTVSETAGCFANGSVAVFEVDGAAVERE